MSRGLDVTCWQRTSIECTSFAHSEQAWMGFGVVVRLVLRRRSICFIALASPHVMDAKRVQLEEWSRRPGWEKDVWARTGLTTERAQKNLYLVSAYM